MNYTLYLAWLRSGLFFNAVGSFSIIYCTYLRISILIILSFFCTCVSPPILLACRQIPYQYQYNVLGGVWEVCVVVCVVCLFLTVWVNFLLDSFKAAYFVQYSTVQSVSLCLSQTGLQHRCMTENLSCSCLQFASVHSNIQNTFGEEEYHSKPSVLLWLLIKLQFNLLRNIFYKCTFSINPY